jgi:hypothetical protein
MTSLQQHSSPFAGDATVLFAVRFDEKTGKFQVVSKKKVPSKE